ncbi:DsbA family protein [Trinickia mobilis]|uniref:DsbA family protein n=1 Tax=Trinickia mobilis TaxID=2816356 RepID=UPI001A8C62C8|nr:DsbA family protein [Trinickia mobilis]
MTKSRDPAPPPLWCYDFISPFSYLLLEQHDNWPEVPFELMPVSLYGLYRHWGQRPGYEVPQRRIFTFRYALFRAEQLGIPFKMPPAHPFDSTKALLLATAARADVACTRAIFRFIWREGRDPSTDEGFADLCRYAGVPDGERLIALEETKAQLQRNGEEAIRIGIFGVPTFRFNDQLFWGEDALPMVLYCARTPNWLESKEVKRISKLPLGVVP